MYKFISREEKIISLLKQESALDIQAIAEKINENISRATLNRTIAKLVELKILTRTGQARSISYKISTAYKLLENIDKEKYFHINVDERASKESFNFEVLKIFRESSNDIFTVKEIDKVNSLNLKYRNSRNELSPAMLKREFERLTIEFAWKSSQIEGNTYSLLDTETLLNSGIQAKGHTQEEAYMLLNHKQALSYIRDNADYFQEINPTKIKELHSILIDKLNIKKQIRKRIVRITGTKYQPLDNEFQLEEALQATCEIINLAKEPICKALIASAVIAYLQAFEDGNKRTSRISSNAILMAHDYCPLSYRSIDVREYKKALILFYEQNNIGYLKELILEQFEFAVGNYWL